VVEAPAGSFVKRRPDGAVDVVSPLPVPWNYGRVDGEIGGDGDPLDAILWGPRRPAGHVEEATVAGVVRFVDAGARDDKLVCGDVGPLGRRALAVFFAVYAPFKRLLHAVRGERGVTGVRGIDWG
jgi:inorganic pyrophosphatase